MPVCEWLVCPLLIRPIWEYKWARSEIWSVVHAESGRGSALLALLALASYAVDSACPACVSGVCVMLVVSGGERQSV